MPLPLKTERLLLRAPTPEDLDAWHAIYLDAEEVWYGAPRSSLDENRAKLLRRLGLESRPDLVRFAIDNGIIEFS